MPENEQNEPARQMAEQFSPTRDQVLFRQHSPEEMTAGGIWLPDASKDAPLRGTVLKVGPDVPKSWTDRENRFSQGDRDAPPCLVAGDIIHFAAYTPISLGEFRNENDGSTVKLCLIKASDVLALGELAMPEGWRVRPQ